MEAARKAAIAEMAEKVDKANKAAKEAKAVRKDAETALAAAQKELEELKARGPEVRKPTAEEKDALTASAVEKALSENNERVRKLEKQLAAADPDTATLMVLFKNWKKTFEEMWDTLRRIEVTDGGKARRLRGGIRKAIEDVANQLKEEAEEGTEQA